MAYRMTHTVPLRAMPQNTSRMECCLTKTVEREISSPRAVIQRRWRRRDAASQAANTTAMEPTQCSEGLTLVLVSKA